MKFKLFFLLIISLIFLNVSGAEEEYFLPLHQYAQRSWRVVSGLSHDNVTSIFIDDAGFIWAGTIEGLTRLDGSSSKIFTTRTFPKMQSNRIVAVDGSKGILYIATAMGVSSFNNNQFTRVEEETGLTGMTVTENGSVYASKDQEILSIFNNKVKRFSIVNGLPEGSVGAIDSYRNILYIGMSSGVVVSYEQELFSNNLCGLNNSPVTSVSAGDSGVIFGTDDGMLYSVSNGICRRLTTEQVYNSGDTAVKSISVKNGFIRAVAGNHLIFIDKDKVRYEKSCCNIPGDVSAVLLTDDGSMLVSGDKGLTMFYPGAFVTLGKDEGLSSDMIYAMLEDKKGKIWVGSRGGGLFYYSHGVFKKVPESSGINSAFIGGLMLDDKENIWVGTSKGVVTFPSEFPVKAKIVSAGKQGTVPLVSVLFEDSRKRIWAGTASGEIYLYINGTFSFIRHIGSGKNEYIAGITEDIKGRLWFATSSGLLMFDNESFKIISSREGLSDNMVLSVFTDSSGIIFAGMMRTGLSVIFPDGEIRSVNTARGLCSDTIYSIIPDNNNDLWFTSTHGIFSLKEDQVIKSTIDPNYSLSCFPFDTQDGIKRPENTGGVQPASMMRDNGDLWFPTVEGIAVSNGASVQQNQKVHVSIDDLSVNGKSVDIIDNGTVLSGDVSLVEIKFTAGCYIHPERLKIRYKLEPFDKAWVYQPDKKMASYQKLSSGLYTFTVEAENEKGDIQSSSITFEVKISNIISMLSSNTIVFVVIAIILISGIVMLFMAGRKKKVMKTVDKKQVLDINEDIATNPGNVSVNSVDEKFVEFDTDIKDESIKYEKSRLDYDIAEAYAAELKELMEKEKPYRNPDLTLPQLAKMLNLSTNILSQVINGHCKLNFYTFINIYRTEAVVKMMKDDSNRQKGILDLAYDAGFKSKTTFNIIFKKHTGLTPSEFRKNVTSNSKNQDKSTKDQ